MILAALLPIFLAAFDIGEAFSTPEAWEESAVDFAVDRAKDGFKFASALGEIAALFAQDKAPPVDVSSFGLKRFS